MFQYFHYKICLLLDNVGEYSYTWYIAPLILNKRENPRCNLTLRYISII